MSAVFPRGYCRAPTWLGPLRRIQATIHGADPLPLRLMWTGEELTKAQVLDMVWELYEKFFHQTNGLALDERKECFERVLDMD